MIELYFKLIHQSEVSVIVMENTLEVGDVFPGDILLHQASLLLLVFKISFQNDNLPRVFPCNTTLIPSYSDKRRRHPTE